MSPLRRNWLIDCHAELLWQCSLCTNLDFIAYVSFNKNKSFRADFIICISVSCVFVAAEVIVCMIFRVSWSTRGDWTFSNLWSSNIVELDGTPEIMTQFTHPQTFLWSSFMLELFPFCIAPQGKVCNYSWMTCKLTKLHAQSRRITLNWVFVILSTTCWAPCSSIIVEKRSTSPWLLSQELCKSSKQSQARGAICILIWGQKFYSFLFVHIIIFPICLSVLHHGHRQVLTTLKPVYRQSTLKYLTKGL